MNTPYSSATTEKLILTVNGQTFTATLAETEAAKTLLTTLPCTLQMEELNGNEKYCYLSDLFPSEDVRPGIIHEGDIMLFDKSCIVVFYKTFHSSYSYTRLAHIDNLNGLRQALGMSNVTVTFDIDSKK